jgi:hypothetical protein
LNKPKTNNKGDTQKVSQMDICQTPPHALEPLYEHIDRMGYKAIWESAHGPEQILVNTLLDKGYSVIATDLSDGPEYNRAIYTPANYDIEITNVPFSIKYTWLQWSFESGKPFALLVPYETTAAAAFHKLKKQYNGKPWRIEKLSPERRINFKMPNMGWGITVWDEKKGKFIKKGESAQMPTCWLTWGLEVHTTKNIDEVLFEYDVPMRSVKYDQDNKPITILFEGKQHGKNKKADR